MAHIMLSLAQMPQPRIGSSQFYDDGSIALTNRPLTCALVILENDGAPRTIDRHNTYMCTEAFVLNMLSFHDGHFLSHPNADKDSRGQMAAVQCSKRYRLPHHPRVGVLCHGIVVA